jgi:beta-lactamase superfamily II metal-dependent hydrolase
MNFPTRCIFGGLALALVCLCHLQPAAANDKDGRFDIYFIDVEGGAATLFVTPAGESLLVDSGSTGNADRDLNRILDVLRDVARLKHLDHAVVSHWHSDHFGNHAALASQIPIKNFWDRGIPETLQEDPKFAENIAPYRAASQNKSKTLKVGDKIPLRSGKTALEMKTVTASGEVLHNGGEVNLFAKENKPQPVDSTDNAKSLSFLVTFGEFRFLTCGDLTWNVEAKLVTPRNPIGKVDLFMVTHHGLDASNNPVLVWDIDPRVTVMCNGPTKGGNPVTQETLRQVKDIQARFQLHRNLELSEKDQAPPDFIANSGTTAECKGVYIKASVAPNGEGYTVQIGADGKQHIFETRP